MMGAFLTCVLVLITHNQKITSHLFLIYLLALIPVDCTFGEMEEQNEYTHG